MAIGSWWWHRSGLKQVRPHAPDKLSDLFPSLWTHNAHRLWCLTKRWWPLMTGPDCLWSRAPRQHFQWWTSQEPMCICHASMHLAQLHCATSLMPPKNTVVKNVVLMWVPRDHSRTNQNLVNVICWDPRILPRNILWSRPRQCRWSVDSRGVHFLAVLWDRTLQRARQWANLSQHSGTCPWVS